MSDSSREAFEQALKDIGYTPSRFETDKKGIYLEHVVNEAWCSWQLATAHMQAELAKQSMQGDAVHGSAKEFSTSDNPHCKDGGDACTDCLMRGSCLMSDAKQDSAKTIAELQAENEALRKDAELGKLVRQKMTSGNDVPVSRCTITAAEIDAAIKGGE